MARIRQFKPSFFTDYKVGLLSREARLFFFGVLSEADDEGRLVDSPKRLAGAVYPFDDDVTPKKVERWIDELEKQRMVLRYTHDGGKFLYVRKFKDHQKMSHPTPSTLPPPPDPPESSSGVALEKLRSDSGGPREDFAPEGVFVFEGVSVVEGVAAEPPPKPAKRATGPPDDFDIDDELRAWARAGAASVIDLERETERFLDHHRAKGSTMKDWRAAWRTWMSRAVDYAPKASPNGVRRQSLGQDAIDSVIAKAEAGHRP